MQTLNCKIEAGLISDYDKFEKDLSDKHGTPVTIFKMCDSCQEEIPRELDSIFQCRICHLNYDLCELCQVNLEALRINSKVECPDGFGCHDDDNKMADTPFLYIKNKPDVYNLKGEKYVDIYRKVDRDLFKMDQTKIDQIAADYDRMKFKFVSLLGNTDYIDHNIINDLWIYYRSTDPECLSKYGRPIKPIDLLDYHTDTLYRQLEINRTFKTYLSEDNTYLCFIYSNGDEFVIEKLSESDAEKYGVPFACYLLPFSKAGLFSRYPTDVINDIKVEYDSRGEHIYVVAGK